MMYENILQYLDELELFGIKLGLDNITALCQLLQNPQTSYKIIHVAGTNGKGSVVAMCSNILKEAGYKVGMYTSPHLQTVRERIQVNSVLIKKKAMITLFLKVKEAADKLKERGMVVTYFEFMTAMALLYFKEEKCGFAIIETGMGGRLDATNIVKPIVAVITNIEVEHSRYLGSTREKIAAEKGGIIKEGSVVVVGEKDAGIQKQLLQICSRKNVRMIAVAGIYDGDISLLGRHQKENAAAAIAAVKSLESAGINISNTAIKKGIANTRWPGRLEVVQNNVILDGSHNPSGIAATADYIKSLDKDIILVLGISEDKEVKKILRIIAPLAKRIIITAAKYRGYECERLLEETLPYNRNAEAIADAKAAVRKAMEIAKDEMVVITGSLFLAGEVRGMWFKKEA